MSELPHTLPVKHIFSTTLSSVRRSEGKHSWGKRVLCMLLCSFVDFDEDLMQPALWVLDLIFDGIGALKNIFINQSINNLFSYRFVILNFVIYLFKIRGRQIC